MTRNYDRESRDTADRKYAYAFDFDVMHPFVLLSFEPFFVGSSVLELGSFRGDFTSRLSARFSDITCVEASPAAAAAARAAGLAVRHRSGIFFKALANFQWDRLLATDIISPEYLEGCYQLGQVYPDLCSSIFLVCEAGAR